MFFHFTDKFPQLIPYLDKYRAFLKRMEISAKTVLLEEGSVSQNYIYVEKGCVRAFFNNNGEAKTVQFFFENEGLTSFESFTNNSPSLLTIEAIEPSVVHLLPKKYVNQLVKDLIKEPEFAQLILQVSAGRQMHYMNEFFSFIRDTPEERYQNLLNNRPHIIQRVPQHYIASYLGVTTVHLSRIKSKIAKGKAHF
ncbi:Crp/Fnr family transcriptional regulator [Mucilaginibacter flavus]|nr:Crp/Fnr family transcriptional regulator [Mucilaginibacter flavus]